MPVLLASEPTLDEVLKIYGDRVKLVWRDKPLPMHPDAALAAELAREALEQRGPDGFWKMHDKLFANQQRLKRDDLDRYGSELGLDPKRLARALDGQTHKSVIDFDDKIGTDIGLTGTPAFMINNYYLSGAQPLPKFKKLIDRALAEAAEATHAARTSISLKRVDVHQAAIGELQARDHRQAQERELEERLRQRTADGLARGVQSTSARAMTSGSSSDMRPPSGSARCAMTTPFFTTQKPPPEDGEGRERRAHVGGLLADDAEVVAVVPDARRDGAVEVAEAERIAVRGLAAVAVTLEHGEPTDTGRVALQDVAIGEDASGADADHVDHARGALEIDGLRDRMRARCWAGSAQARAPCPSRGRARRARARRGSRSVAASSRMTRSARYPGATAPTRVSARAGPARP